MSVKPELAFDVCWEVYRGAREVLETKRGISALKLGKAGKFLWRPDVQARLKALNIEYRGNTPEEFRAFVAAETEKWGRVVREAGIKLG